jgi:hypothetical protein
MVLRISQSSIESINATQLAELRIRLCRLFAEDLPSVASSMDEGARRRFVEASIAFADENGAKLESTAWRIVCLASLVGGVDKLYNPHIYRFLTWRNDAFDESVSVLLGIVIRRLSEKQ